MPSTLLPQLLYCPNRCEYQMRVKSLREEGEGIWRLGSVCAVCLTEVERSLPELDSEAEHEQLLVALRQLMHATQGAAAGQ
ncbi:MAG: hypothetical protein J0L64_05185 [Acidobacteria bacterium]|nr:hypothetical protein [Acidobacteriota bacterium]